MRAQMKWNESYVDINVESVYLNFYIARPYEQRIVIIVVVYRLLFVEANPKMDTTHSFIWMASIPSSTYTVLCSIEPFIHVSHFNLVQSFLWHSQCDRESK